MLIIEQQPSVLIPHQIKPTEWLIRKTDHVVTPGVKARIIVSFNAGGGANGQEITLNGQTFTTASGTYTAETWNYSATVSTAAKNFANMIRSSYAFHNWSISVDGSAAPIWTVYIEANETGLVSPFDNDMSTLSPAPVSTSFDAGTDEVLSGDKFWYQFWQGNNPVSEQKFAAFDATGRVRVDAYGLARNTLGIVDPLITWTSSRFDERASQEIYLRFGSYSESDNCTRAFNQSYESPNIRLVNSIFQHEYVLGFYPFTPNFTLPVRWLTQRPMDRWICRESYDFCAVFLQRTALFTNGFYRVIYTYYNDSDGVLNTKTENLTNYPDGVYHVPIGPANLVHPAGVIALAAYYTVQVFVQGGDSNYVAYSELMTLQLNSCNCWAAEVYYLEDTGSWRTVVFEKVDSRSIEMDAVEWTAPVEHSYSGGPINGIQLYQNGGTESRADEARKVFALVTERITEYNRKAYEDFLVSSRHIILTTSDFIPAVTRRIVLERGTYGVYQRGESKRLVIPFRFNTNLRTR